MKSNGLCLLLVLCTSVAAHAQLEDRTPTGGSAITTRKCIGGSNAGARCRQDSQCDSNNCFPYNVVSLSVNLRTAAGGGWTPTADQLTAMQADFVEINDTVADISDGQMVLGTVSLIVNNGAPNATVQVSAGACTTGLAVCTTDAECGANGPCMLGGGSANTGGWGADGKMTLGLGCVQNPLCFAHEFVHLVANARDEYEGALDDGVDNNANGTIDECGENQAQTRCFGGTSAGQPCTGAASCPGGACRQITCIDPGPPDDPTSVLGCLMRCCLANTDSELCVASNHDADADTEQSQCRAGNSCWTQFGIEWPSVVNVPTGLPDPGPTTAPAPVSFLTPSTLDRFVAVIDRSDSMTLESPRRIDVAVTATRDFIDLLTAGAEFGLASFASEDGGDPSGVAATKDFPATTGLRALNTATDRSDARAAIDGLSSRAAGFTQIGAGLRQALAMFREGSGTVTLNSSVLLLTDGINNRPDPGAQADLDDALTALSEAGLPVFVSCIGEARDSTQCSAIADRTSGRFVDSQTTDSLFDAFVEFVASAEGNGISTSRIGTPIASGELSSAISSVVEVGATSARFVVSWSNAATNLDLQLFRPDGTQVAVGSRIQGSQGEFYRIANPTPGTWTMRVLGVAVPEPDRFSVRSLLENEGLSAEAGLSKSTVQWPQGFLVNVHPHNGRPIEGCTASAQVQKPDGSSETFALRDDGTSGDAEEGDGLYQTEFRNLTAGDGIYTFTVRIRCEAGAAHVHVHDDPGIGTFPINPAVQTFERVVRFSGVASGVPANLPPTAAICADVRAECAGSTTSVALDGRCSTDPEGGALSYAWYSPFAVFDSPTAPQPTGYFPLGRNDVSLVVTDPLGLSSAPDDGLVVIADTTPPLITALIASADRLWPPDHKMVTVALTPTVLEVCDPAPACEIASVTSSEPDNGLGDGDVPGDIDVVGTLAVNLRAERAGAGPGRTYSVEVRCTDASGNASSAVTSVLVPLSQR